jgi:hypothetical protein
LPIIHQSRRTVPADSFNALNSVRGCFECPSSLGQLGDPCTCFKAMRHHSYRTTSPSSRKRKDRLHPFRDAFAISGVNSQALLLTRFGQVSIQGVRVTKLPNDTTRVHSTQTGVTIDGPISYFIRLIRTSFIGLELGAYSACQCFGSRRPATDGRIKIAVDSGATLCHCS